jgi:hypothetical protein
MTVLDQLAGKAEPCVDVDDEATASDCTHPSSPAAPSVCCSRPGRRQPHSTIQMSHESPGMSDERSVLAKMMPLPG